MEIAGFDIRLIVSPLAREVAWAGGVSETANEMLTLRIETDGGLFGLAQKKIHPAWSGMSLAMAARELREVLLPLLKGMDPLRPECIWAKIDALSGWSPARVLIDIALTDLAARAAGLPVWKYLGGWSDTVELLGFNARGESKARLATIAAEIERFGYRGYKIKIGTDADKDIGFLRMVRAEFPGLRIRVDANSGYDLETALRVSRHLADLGVEDFEDPCLLTGKSVRRALQRKSAVPVVVDNIIDSVRAAREVLEEGTLRMALKVSRLGYRRATEIVSHCRAFGCRVIAGSMTESTLGALGAMHFHAAHRDFAWSPSEESYFATLAQDAFPMPRIVGGKVVLGDQPGLAPDWDREALARLTRPLDG